MTCHFMRVAFCSTRFIAVHADMDPNLHFYIDVHEENSYVAQYCISV